MIMMMMMMTTEDVTPERGCSSVNPRPPLKGRSHLPRTRYREERRLNSVKELLVTHRAVDPRRDRLLGVGLRPQQVHLVLQLCWAAVLQDVAHLVVHIQYSYSFWRKLNLIRVSWAHRVEVDLAHVVQLVPVWVSLVHNCAFQMDLWKVQKVSGRFF